jgi:hypothetical protein
MKKTASAPNRILWPEGMVHKKKDNVSPEMGEFVTACFEAVGVISMIGIGYVLWLFAIALTEPWVVNTIAKVSR